MRKTIRTSERCYICDFSSPMEHLEDGEIDYIHSASPSIYNDGLIGSAQDSTGRFVFLSPRDGKPVCTQCSRSAVSALISMRRSDQEKAGETYSWASSNHELFSKWEKILAQESSVEPPAQGAGTRVETELETT